LHSVNQPRPALFPWWCGGASGAQPPFWELESLLLLGFARDAALQRIAARRALTDRGVMADRSRSFLDLTRAHDAAHG